MLRFFARHCNLTSYFTLIKLEVEASMCNLVNWKCMRFKSLWIAFHMVMWIWYFVYCWMKKISWNGLFCFVFGSYQWQTFHTSTLHICLIFRIKTNLSSYLGTLLEHPKELIPFTLNCINSSLSSAYYSEFRIKLQNFYT